MQTCDTNGVDWTKPGSELLEENSKQSDGDVESDDSNDTRSSTTETVTLSEASSMVEKLNSFALHGGHSERMGLVAILNDEIHTCQT